MLGEIIRASRRKAPGKNFDFERRRIPGCENFSEIVSNTKRKGREKRDEQLGFKTSTSLEKKFLISWRD